MCLCYVRYWPLCAHSGHRLHDRRCLKAVIHPDDLNREQIVTHQSGIKTTFLLYQTAGGAMTAG